MAVVRYYDESKSQGGTLHIYGVPAADLTEEQYEALPKHLQMQVDESAMYRKTKPSSESDKQPDKPAANKAEPTKVKEEEG